ncbi:MAG TPA: hypothetical protein VMI72_04775 [Roseiarcus sp.]|nr:hypothetical protein [Roseiarcus sp.]
MLTHEADRVGRIAGAVERAAAEEQLAWLRETDMAVIVSSSQNEIALYPALTDASSLTVGMVFFAFFVFFATKSLI